jgi:Secretion system C-terminal sorting domain
MTKCSFTAVCIFIFFSNKLFAQTGAFSTTGTTYYFCAIKYEYDASGNRTMRYYQCDVEVIGAGAGAGARKLKPAAGQISAPSALLVYPNPTSTEFTIQLPKNTHLGHLVVADNQGKILLNKPLTNNISDIDISNFAVGHYSLRITLDKITFNNTIIKNQ